MLKTTLITGFLFSFLIVSSQNYVNLNLPVDFGGKFIEKHDGRLFASGFYSGGLKYSDDDGANWSSTNWPNTTLSAVSLLNYNGFLYALTSKELFRSSDNGDTWTDITGPLEPGFSNYFGQSIYVVNDTIFVSIFGYGMYKTTDEGANWTSITNFPNQDFVNIYGMVNTSSGLLAYGFYGVMRSTDDGATWQSVFYDPDFDYIFSGIVEVNGNLYGNTGNKGVVKSTDNGATWTVVYGCTDGKSIYSFEGDPRIYAGCQANLAYSDDEGDTWNNIYDSAMVEYIFGLNIIDSKLYVNVWDGGLFRAEDFDPFSTLSTEESNVVAHSIYPNPTEDMIAITLVETNATTTSCKIHNILGQEVAQDFITATNNTIDVRNLSPGVYFVNISNSNNDVSTFKFIKK